MALTRREFVQTGATALAGLGVWNRKAAALTAEPQRPNFVFVMTDQWRGQALGFMKQDPVQTPCLDAFAREALSFSNGIACAPVCGPNRACWLTGRYPQNHGVLKNEAAPVNPDHLLSLPLKQAGYRLGYVGKWHLSGKAHPRRDPTPAILRRDYDYWYRAENHTHFQLRYDVNGEMKSFGPGWQPDHETDTAIGFIKQQAGRPFSLVLSFGPPHNGSYPGHGEKRYTPGMPAHRDNGYGYYAPRDYEALYAGLGPDNIRRNVRSIAVKGENDTWESCAGAIKGYFGACSAVDAAFGRLIDYLREAGLYDNTIVAFSSDHGEMLGSHGLMTKGVGFEESLNVPLLLRVPGVVPRRDDVLFNSPDLVPTLFGLAGVALPSGVDGVDHSALIRDSSKRRTEPELAYVGYANWRGWRGKRYTYLSGVKSAPLGGRESAYLRRFHHKESGHMLFDRQNDPYQLRPVFKGDGKASDALIDDLHGELYATLKARGEWIPERAS